MLKPAGLYKEQLRLKEIESMYNMNNIYFHAWCGGGITDIKDNNYDCHIFVSVNDNDEVIGFIAYDVDHNSLNTSDWGVVSFDKGNLTFIKDLYTAIYNVFYKYNFNRIGWSCYADNPAIKGYRKFINRVGGKECGYKRENKMLLDHKLHDTVEFEILKREFKPIKKGILKQCGD